MTGPEHVALPKWPGLLVEGDLVTPDQAAEIIIRTSGLEFHTNDGAFSTALYQELGLYVANRWGFPKHHLWTAVRERYGVLSLHYLENAQIVSSWIGGPHGWCSWDGTIGCGHFNIGKWPTVEEVAEDWETIAQAFPYLNLRAQLLSGEECEDDTRPVVEFTVAGGSVAICGPGERIQTRRPVSTEEVMMRMLAVGGERGCTIEQFAEALAVTERSLGRRP